MDGKCCKVSLIQPRSLRTEQLFYFTSSSPVITAKLAYAFTVALTHWEGLRRAILQGALARPVVQRHLVTGENCVHSVRREVPEDVLQQRSLDRAFLAVFWSRSVIADLEFNIVGPFLVPLHQYRRVVQGSRGQVLDIMNSVEKRNQLNASTLFLNNSGSFCS